MKISTPQIDRVRTQAMVLVPCVDAEAQATCLDDPGFSLRVSFEEPASVSILNCILLLSTGTSITCLKRRNGLYSPVGVLDVI